MHLQHPNNTLIYRSGVVSGYFFYIVSKWKWQQAYEIIYEIGNRMIKQPEHPLLRFLQQAEYIAIHCQIPSTWSNSLHMQKINLILYNLKYFQGLSPEPSISIKKQQKYVIWNFQSLIIHRSWSQKNSILSGYMDQKVCIMLTCTNQNMQQICIIQSITALVACIMYYSFKYFV